MRINFISMIVGVSVSLLMVMSGAEGVSGTTTQTDYPNLSPSLISNCSWNGIELKGKVQFVESFPDIKVQFVQSFPDIKVKLVESFPDDCGEWQVVESFPDFKVQIVESFPDIKVQLVDSFPGIN